MKAGIAGIGFMGWIHYLAYQQSKAAELVAVQSRNEAKRSGDWRGIQGNFGPPGEQIDLGEIAAYETFEELLADDSVDVIDICLPPNLHADAAVKALEAGKHVLCEKPMALNPADCDRMMDAASAAGKMLMVAHVLPFFREYTAAREIIASGKYGNLLGGHFRRVISDPTWIDNFYDPEGAGGPLVDLHVHDAHLIRMLFGMPVRVCSQGRMRGEVVEYCTTQFHYDDPSLVVSANGGVIHQQGRGFMHGFEIHLEQATLHFEFSFYADEPEGSALKILTPDGKVERPELPEMTDIDAFTAQLDEAAAAIASGKESAVLSAGLARDALVLCQRQTTSVRERRAVDV